MWKYSLLSDKDSNYLMIYNEGIINNDSTSNTDSGNADDSNSKKIKSVENELSQKFIFSVERYRNDYSKEESIKIIVEYIVGTIPINITEDTPKDSYDFESIVEIETNLIDLSRDILDLRKYGVVLKRKSFNEISKIIEDNYLTIKPKITILDINKAVCNICKYYALDIENLGIVPCNGLYNMPVTEFKEYTNEYYSQYKYSDIRKCLSELTVADIKKCFNINDLLDLGNENRKITKCSFGRTDNTVVDNNNKRVKVISFIEEIIDMLKEVFVYEEQ